MVRWKTGCHNLIISGVRWAGRAAGGRRAPGGRRPRRSRSHPRRARASERDAEPTQHAGDKRPVVKQKECCRRRFEAPAPVPRPNHPF